jgi:hypothetical protein
MHACFFCTTTSADAGNTAIRKVNATTGIIITLADSNLMVYAARHVLALADGLVYFTPQNTGLDCKLFQYDSSTNSFNNSTLGDAQCHLTGMAVNPATQQLNVVDNNSAGTGALYSVDVSGSFNSTPPVTSFVTQVPGGLETIACNGSDAAYLTGPIAQNIYKLPTGGVAEIWDNGTFGPVQGGLATDAVFGFPYAVAVDGAGNMLISTQTNCLVWLVDAATGRLQVVAGNNNDCGDAVVPDNPGMTRLNNPTGLAFGPGGGYAVISDTDNHRILKVKMSCVPPGVCRVANAQMA